MTDHRPRGRRTSPLTASGALAAAPARAGHLDLALILTFPVVMVVLLHEPTHQRIQELLQTVRGLDEPAQ